MRFIVFNYLLYKYNYKPFINSTCKAVVVYPLLVGYILRSTLLHKYFIVFKSSIYRLYRLSNFNHLELYKTIYRLKFTRVSVF